MTLCSVLSLGSRKDAPYWYDNCHSQLGLAKGADLVGPGPSENDLVKFFGRSDEWLYLAGHFTLADHLYNESRTVFVRFADDSVTIRHNANTTVLKKNRQFNQHKKLKLVFWGGCSVHADPALIRTLRTLFGGAQMIGWNYVTGWEMPYSVMGGFGNQPPHASKDFFDRVASNVDDEGLVTKAWLKTAFATTWGKPPNPAEPEFRTRFSVIEHDGQEYVLGPRGIVKGGSFSSVVS